MPLILPGVISGALFAFITSFDEVVVVVLFIGSIEQITIPKQMWAGLKTRNKSSNFIYGNMFSFVINSAIDNC